eukprot:7342009-Alexandrium_andersonii.AAC.2
MVKWAKSGGAGIAMTIGQWGSKAKWWAAKASRTDKGQTGFCRGAKGITAAWVSKEGAAVAQDGGRGGKGGRMAKAAEGHGGN